jgi:hypothetical protein
MGTGQPVADDNQGSPALKYLIGGAGVLQAVLASIGASNGGISAMIINYRVPALIGLGSVLAAIAIGAFGLLAKGQITKPLGVIGTGLLFLGIAITGWAALVSPALAKAPNIDVNLSHSEGGLVLSAEIKASGIPQGEQYWIEVDAREYLAPSANGGSSAKYVQLGTPLYQQQLGADSQGNIDSTVTMPVPAGTYPAVSVEAWAGAHSGPCGSLGVAGGANLANSPETSSNLEQVGRSGCAIVRLPR